MTRLTDGRRTLEINMADWEPEKLTYTPDWSRDFFEVGNLDYDEEKDAYRVWDVEFALEYALDWKLGTGDFNGTMYEKEPQKVLDLHEVFWEFV